jgi:hypothetical protein
MNESLQKSFLTLNRAGDSSFNPICIGNSFTITLDFDDGIKSINGYLQNKDKTEETELTIIPITSLQYQVLINVGESPFTQYEKCFLKFIIQKGNDSMIIEKSCYFSEDVSDSVWIFNTDTQVFEKALTDYSQVCTENCGIQFFPNIKNEFGILTYGGFKYISVFDGNSLETETSQRMVRRIHVQPIQNYNQIYLVKRTIGEEEHHWVTIRFRTHTTDTYYLEKIIKIKSISCYGFLIEYPQIDE